MKKVIIISGLFFLSANAMEKDNTQKKPENGNARKGWSVSKNEDTIIELLQRLVAQQTAMRQELEAVKEMLMMHIFADFNSGGSHAKALRALICNDPKSEDDIEFNKFMRDGYENFKEKLQQLEQRKNE